MKRVQLRLGGWEKLWLVPVVPAGVVFALGLLGATFAAVPLLIEGELGKLALLGGGLACLFGFLALGSRFLERRWFARLGSDGLLVARGLRRRFVPWRRISTVRPAPKLFRVVLELDDGSHEVLYTKEVEQLAKLLEKAIAERAAAEPAQRLRVLDPGEDAPERFVERMKTVARSEGYRVAEVTEDSLCAVLSDPSQERSHRFAAAVALAEASVENRERIRVVAQDTADPDLASALEDVTAGSVRAARVRRVLGQ